MSGISYCDVIPENSHRVEKCVKIINIADFPDISLLGYIMHPSGDHNGTYIIDPNTCLEKGYKFSTLYILAVKNSYLSKKDLNSIDWLANKNALKSNIPIECYGGYVEDNNPISSIEEFYKIAGFTDTEVILYKCKELIKYNDGRPYSLKTYSYVDGREKLNEISVNEDNSTIKIYPSNEIVNFLKALFITILVELIVLFILFRTKYKALNIKTYLLLAVGILASLSTLPYVWFVLPIFIKTNLIYIITSELSVIIIESLLIFGILRIDYKKALIVSIICNVTSFLIGLAINWAKFL